MPLIQFKSEQDRQRDFRVLVIPKQIWHAKMGFNNKFDSDYLPFVQTSNFQKVLKLAQKSRLDKPKILLCIASTRHLSKSQCAELIHYMISRPAIKIESVLKTAAISGNFNLVQTLFQKKSKHQIKSLLYSGRYAAFRLACEYGHQAVAEYLMSLNADKATAMNGVCVYHAFRQAASHGHLAIMQWLISIDRVRLNRMIEAHDFYAFRNASQNGYTEIALILMRHSVACFRFAEMHSEEYELPLIHYIAQELERLHNHHAQVLSQSGAAFDVTDRAQLRRYYYILKNLIRRNDTAHTGDIRFLLAIPSLRAMVHLRIDGGLENDLMRLARMIGNHAAATALAEIPAVNRIAEQHGQYRREEEVGLSAVQLAENSESSMVELSQGERNRLQGLLERYEPIVKQKGLKNVIAEFKQVLEKKFNANRPTVSRWFRKDKRLPFDHMSYLSTTMWGTNRTDVLREYYKNIYHTAFRYLSKPNYLMDPRASYVCVYEEDQSLRYAMFEPHLKLIAILYLAAIDRKYPPRDGQTYATRLDNFIRAVALIGRAHNWDKKRKKTVTVKGKKKVITEQYDDMGPDKSSCGSGVRRRLLQGVLGHDLLKILTNEILQQLLNSFIFEHLSAALKRQDNPSVIRAAFEDYSIMLDDMSLENVKLLMEFNIPTAKIEAFQKSLAAQFGKQFDRKHQDYIRAALTLPKFDSDSVAEKLHILKLDKHINFYENVLKKLPDLDKVDDDSLSVSSAPKITPMPSAPLYQVLSHADIPGALSSDEEEELVFEPKRKYSISPAQLGRISDKSRHTFFDDVSGFSGEQQIQPIDDIGADTLSSQIPKWGDPDQPGLHFT